MRKQYLVVLRHTMDDLPLAIFGNRKKAEVFAKRARPMPSNKVRNIYLTDCSTPVGVDIYVFVGGAIKNAFRVKDFEE
jgi:hypothetical protein